MKRQCQYYMGDVHESGGTIVGTPAAPRGGGQEDTESQHRLCEDTTRHSRIALRNKQPYLQLFYTGVAKL